MVVVTAVVALGVTGDLGAAIDIGIAANLVETGTDDVHQRLWARVDSVGHLTVR